MKELVTQSLNVKIVTAFVIISIVSILTVAFFSFTAAENLLKNRITSQLLNEAKYRAEIIKHIWSLRVEQTQALASSEKIKSILQKSNMTSSAQNSNQQDLEDDIQPILEDSNLSDLIIINKNGKVILATNKNLVGTNLSQDPRFIRAVKEPFYTIQKDPSTGKAIMIVLAPVKVNETGSSDTLGVIETSRDIALANQITTDRANLGSTGENYLVNPEGFMITESRFVGNAPFNLKVNTYPVRECFDNGTQASGIYPDYRGIPVFGASYCSRENGFVLLAESDVAEIYSPITDLRNQYVIIGSVIAVGVGILSFFIARTISGPIIRLTHIAESISRGDMSLEIEEPKSKTEIDRLQHSFRIMVFNLRQLIGQIQRLNEQLKQVNEELRLKDKIKDEFISIASHELKNPIQPILGFAYLAKKGKIPHDEAWDGVLQHARRLKRLATDILDVSKIESGTLDYRFTKFRLNQAIEDVVESLKVNLFPEVRMDVILDQKDPEIDADRERIIQVLENIIDNAIRFTKKGSIKIESRVDYDHNKIDVIITDTGGGISQDIFPNLFGKFVTRSVKDGMEHGTGLGLFISKVIITAHKGEIVAYNNNIGGATFAFNLPINNTTDQRS
jgi:signal transduction histidine kinase